MKLHVFPASPNARKTMVVAELLGLDIETVIVDLRSGAQRSSEFLALNPNGKVPALELDDGTTLWESNAIVNRLASEVDTDLWPKSDLRYDILRWQFWEGCHWTPACGKFISKHFFGNDEIDLAAAAEDFRFFAGVLDGHLAGRAWLAGEGMTNADISVAAILCYREPCRYPMDGFAHIESWMARIEDLPAWQRVNPA